MAMSALRADITVSLRQLFVRPGLTAAAVISLALGIGANIAVFSALNGFLFKPLPYPHSDQLFAVTTSLPAFDLDKADVSIPIYYAIKNKVSAFSSVAVSQKAELSLKIGARATAVNAVKATGSLFQVLGIKPFLGRSFTNSNSQIGRNKVAVISYRMWRSRFSADPDVIGRTIKLDGKLYKVVGVMPSTFEFPDKATNLWIPLVIEPSDKLPAQTFHLDLKLTGRLKPGARPLLQSQIKAAQTQIIEHAAPEDKADVERNGFYVTARSYRELRLAGREGELLLLQGAALLILLIAAINVANLLLSRTLERTHELALRAALGARHVVLARQLFVEALCLAVPSGLIGIALGWFCLQLIAISPFHSVNSIFDIGLSWRIGLITLGIILAVGTGVSALPVFHLSKLDIQSVLQEGGRSVAGGRRTRRASNFLVAVEVVLATALLGCAGLLLHSLNNLEHSVLGFNSNNLLTASVIVPRDFRATEKMLRRTRQDLLKQVRSLPGVRSAAISSSMPFGYYLPQTDFDLRGKDFDEATTAFTYVTDGYFNALGVPTLRGRSFGREDTRRSQPVAIVGARFARRYFGDHNPIGKMFTLGAQSNNRWLTVVGVVPSIKLQDNKLSDSPPEVYLSAAQFPPYDTRLLIRTSLPPEMMSRPLQSLVATVNPSLAITDIMPMHQRLAAQRGGKRMTSALLVTFGGLALLLAMVGIYGVLRYAASKRTQECGIRLALGASQGDLLWLIIKDGLKLLTIGLVVGLAITIIFGFVVSSRLYGVAPYDPTTLFSTAFVLSVITMIASYLPARRVARLDPAIALQKK